MEGKLEVLKDPKQEIKFWLDALNNPNIDRESKEMLNKCLYFELHKFLYPVEYMKIKTDPMPIDKINGSTSTLFFK